MRYAHYDSAADHTYAFGVYAVLEALSHSPTAVRVVLHDGRVSPERLAALERACAAAGTPLEQDPRTLERLRHRSDVEMMAVVTKIDEPLSPAGDHALLVAPSHGGNLGTAIRSLLAFGIDEIALLAPRVDSWSTHVVRASVGLRFAVRCRTFSDVSEYLAACGPRTLHLFDASAAADARAATFDRPFTLAFGPEGPLGAPALSEARADADWTEPLRAAVAARSTAAEPVGLALHRIDIDDRAESLNLAAAVTIAAFLAGRRRDGRIGPA